MCLTFVRGPVQRVAAGNEDRVVDVLVRAFADDPVARWLYPDPDHYFDSFPALVQAFGGTAFEQGTAHYADDFFGAALWLPPGVQGDDAELDAVLERTIAARDLKAANALFEAMGDYHPKEPHWHLPLIGVDPRHQGKGYGSALLRYALAACDRDGLPAYLEATHPRNMALYERHGFERLGTIQVADCPPVVPMLRRPRGG
jgi:GNAT superfamily N-acetyltransferase